MTKDAPGFFDVDEPFGEAPRQRSTLEEKKGDQGEPHSPRLEGQAEQTRAEGPGGPGWTVK